MQPGAEGGDTPEPEPGASFPLDLTLHLCKELLEAPVTWTLPYFQRTLN